MINRTDVFSMPKTSRKRSETASATLGWSKKSSKVAMNTPSRTTRVTRSSEPKCFFRRREDVQSRSVGGVSSSLGIELFPQPANILRLVVDDREHPAKEKQVPGLHRLHVRAERCRGCRKLNYKVLQPAIRAALLRTLLRVNERFSVCHRYDPARAIYRYN